MKTITFNYPHPSGGYGCSEPGNNSGEYVRAEVVKELLAACKAAKEVLDDLPCGAAEVLRMIDAAISKEEQAPENPA